MIQAFQNCSKFENRTKNGKLNNPNVVLCINFHFLPSPLCMLVAYPMGAGTYLVIETFQLNGKRMKRS